jgi:short-subunit dehydrogenase
MLDLSARYGEFALVTGASSGIGAEFAAQLADRGFSLVLVARRQDRLDAIARDLRTRTGVRVVTQPLDLAGPGAVEELVTRTRGLDVGLVVAAAGTMVAGAFIDNDYTAETAVVTLNTTTVMQLAHRYGHAMAGRRRGALVLVSSTVGHTAVPYSANYAATKAYVSALGRALHYELKPAGVDVLTLVPGPTRTEGFASAEGIDFTRMPLPPMPATAVVRAALRGLGRRRSVVVPGLVNKVGDVAARLMPRSWLTALFGRLMSRALVPVTPVSTSPTVPTRRAG